MISIGWTAFFVIYCILVCSCCGVKHRYPLNMVFLVLMASAMGVSLGALCCFLDFDAIVAAGFGTICIVAGVTGLTFWSKFDITRFTHILFLLPFAFMFTWLWFPILGGDAGYYTWMSFAVAMMTGFLAWGELKGSTRTVICRNKTPLAADFPKKGSFATFQRSTAQNYLRNVITGSFENINSW